MLKFALKNMAVKKIQIILIVISIVISAGVGVLAFNVSSQVSDGITDGAAFYSAIIGPSGSSTQLAMNTMYFTDEPLGTIPYSVVTELRQNMYVTSAIPFAMADSYSGFSVVGTTSGYLDGREIKSGRMFDDSSSLEVVLGYEVARATGTRVGDSIYTSHSVGDEHTTPLTVVGIMKKTNTTFDNVVFTQISTIWDVHDHSHENEGEHDEHDEHGEHGEHSHAEKTVCAILVKAKNPGYAMSLVNEYDGKIYNTADGESYSLQAIEPMNTVRGILNDTNNTKYIVFVLCAIILVMNVIIISIITLLNMYHSAKEINLMRLIGISMARINLLYVLQNGIIGLLSVVLSFALSRGCLVLMQDYVSSMGVVLSTSRVYPAELIILIGIFAISVIPTVICTAVMARKSNFNS